MASIYEDLAKGNEASEVSPVRVSGRGEARLPVEPDGSQFEDEDKRSPVDQARHDLSSAQDILFNHLDALKSKLEYVLGPEWTEPNAKLMDGNDVAVKETSDLVIFLESRTAQVQAMTTFVRRLHERVEL